MANVIGSGTARRLVDSDGDPLDNGAGKLNVSGILVNSLVPVAFDEMVLTYSGDNIATVVYKQSSSAVATLTLTYDGDNITRIVRS